MVSQRGKKLRIFEGKRESGDEETIKLFLGNPIQEDLPVAR